MGSRWDGMGLGSEIDTMVQPQPSILEMGDFEAFLT